MRRDRLDLIVPDWAAPGNVRACTTTRAGGVSEGGYGGLNLADHVGDRPERVAENRARLRQALALPQEPFWLRQVHGTVVVRARTDAGVPVPEADASYAREVGPVCVVLTADCLPVLLCDRHGTRVAAAHAGWRGLVGGVIEATVAALQAPPEDLLAWLGPAIGPAAFEVGPEVRAAFMQADPEAASAFVPSRPDRYLADLYELARQRLARLGVGAVYGGQRCSYREPERFYSYRREPVTGRMASLIWLAS